MAASAPGTQRPWSWSSMRTSHRPPWAPRAPRRRVGSTRSADARAHERCRVLVITKVDFDDLLFLHKDLAYEVLWSCVRMLSSRLRETNDKLTFLSTTGKF